MPKENSGHAKTLLDEVGHQALRPLLIFIKHLMRAADLIPFEAIQESDTNNSGCKKAKATLRCWIPNLVDREDQKSFRKGDRLIEKILKDSSIFSPSGFFLS